MNIFADHYQRYQEAGYSVIPILPGAKRPGYSYNGEANGMANWQAYCSEMLSGGLLSLVNSDVSEAGIGIALGYNNVVGIDLDYGSDEIRDAIEDLLPDSPAVKRGAKGYTAFFRTENQIESRKFTIRNESVCEILSFGRQSVLPPTIHPDTSKPYEWDDLPLCSVDPLQLPTLPDNFSDLVVNALEPFGYEERRGPTGEFDGGETSFSELNRVALDRISDWIHTFGVEVQNHRNGSYRIKARWRGGDGWSISVHPGGIRDFARDESMSPLDLVMKMESCEIDTAFTVLSSILGLGGEDDGVDWEKLASDLEKNQERKDSATESALDKAEKEVVVDGTVELMANHRIPRSRDTIEEILMSSTGLFRDVMVCLNNNMVQKSPIMSGAVTLSFLSLLFGRRWALPHGGDGWTFPNIYVIGVAESGVGKSTALNIAQKMFDRGVDKGFALAQDDTSGAAIRYAEYLAERDGKEASDYMNGALLANGLKDAISESDTQSKGGIHAMLLSNPLKLLVVDEFANLAARMFNRQNMNGEAMQEMLKNLLSKPDYKLAQEARADRKSGKMPVMNPHMSMLGLTTPGRLWEAVPAWAFRDGFMGRMVLMVDDEMTPRTPVDTTDNELVVELVAEIIKHRLNPNEINLGGFLIPEIPIEPVRVEYSEAAKLMLDEANDWKYEELVKIKKSGRQDGEIWQRFIELAIKISLIHALGRNHIDPIVDEQDIRFGLKLAMASASLMAEKATPESVQNEAQDRAMAATRNIFLKRGPKVSMRTFYNIKLPKKGILEIMDILIAKGKVVESTDSKGKLAFTMIEKFD